MRSSGRKRDLEAAIEDARHRVKAIQAEKDASRRLRGRPCSRRLNLIGVTGDALRRRMGDEFDVDVET